MTPVSSPMLATGTLVQSHGSDREKLAGVARQFEAILVRQMLAAARKADFGDSLFGGQAMETFTTMQDEQFADLAAKAGSFGLAKMIESQLAQQAGLDAPLPPAGGAGGGPVGQPQTVTSPPLAPPASGRGTKASVPAAGKA